MVKIVNRHNAPGPLIRYANSKQYDAGDSDFTATTLTDEPRIKILTEKYEDEIEDDPYESPWKYLSTIFHALMAGAAGDNEISEERVFTEFQGQKISGAMDLQKILRDDEDNFGVIIGDYKMTGAYSLKDTLKWEQQLNIYAWLLEKEKPHFKVIGLEIYAFIRDWSMATSERSEDYPPTPGVTIDLPLWSFEEREAYVSERLKAHLDARENLPECSHEGRWPGGKSWQVWEGNTLVDTFRLKRDATAALTVDSEMESVIGRYRRCESFCPIAGHCDQYKDWQSSRLPGFVREESDGD
jgi:hypothetical protein